MIVLAKFKPTPKVGAALADAISNLAWQLLAHPGSADLPYSCRRLLGDAAFGVPLCRDAARTIIEIGREIAASRDQALDTLSNAPKRKRRAA